MNLPEDVLDLKVEEAVLESPLNSMEVDPVPVIVESPRRSPRKKLTMKSPVKVSVLPKVKPAEPLKTRHEKQALSSPHKQTSFERQEPSDSSRLSITLKRG